MKDIVQMLPPGSIRNNLLTRYGYYQPLSITKDHMNIFLPLDYYHVTACITMIRKSGTLRSLEFKNLLNFLSVCTHIWHQKNTTKKQKIFTNL
jgi:hypothetical protein